MFKKEVDNLLTKKKDDEENEEFNPFCNEYHLGLFKIKLLDVSL